MHLWRLLFKILIVLPFEISRGERSGVLKKAAASLRPPRETRGTKLNITNGD